jgi:hypothetical protein
MFRAPRRVGRRRRPKAPATFRPALLATVSEQRSPPSPVDAEDGYAQSHHWHESHSRSLDHCRRARPPLIAIASALGCPTRDHEALAARHTRVHPGTDVAFARCSKLHAQARSVSGVHVCLYARPRPASRRSRPAAPLRRQPTIRPPNGPHPRTSRADPTTAWGRAQHRSPCSSRTAPGPTLTPAGTIEVSAELRSAPVAATPVNRRES